MEKFNKKHLIVGRFFNVRTCTYFALRERVFFALFVAISFFSFSQNTAPIISSVDGSEGEVIITNIDQMHIEGDAFVYTARKTFFAEKKNKNSKSKVRKHSTSKNLAKIRKQKTFSQNLKFKNVKRNIFKLHSREEESELINSKAFILKLAITPLFNEVFAETIFSFSIIKKLELLYQQRNYFYTTNLGTLNFSEVFSVRPPPSFS